MTAFVRTLIADDAPEARALARLVLQDAGCIVVAEAHDGEEATRLARSHRPDLVVMDFQMPGIDGIEATRHISFERPETVIVGWTSREDPEIVRGFIEAGARTVLHKHDADGLRALPRSLFGPGA